MGPQEVNFPVAGRFPGCNPSSALPFWRASLWLPLKSPFELGESKRPSEGYRSPTCRLSNTYQRNVSGTVAACVGGSEGCPTFPAEQSCFGAFLADTAWFQSLDGCLRRQSVHKLGLRGSHLRTEKSTPVFFWGHMPCLLLRDVWQYVRHPPRFIGIGQAALRHKRLRTNNGQDVSYPYCDHELQDHY